MDLFEEYLEKKHTNQRVIRALTAESYKNKYHSLENYDYVLTFPQYYPYGPEFFIFGGLYKKTGIRSNDWCNLFRN